MTRCGIPRAHRLLNLPQVVERRYETAKPTVVAFAARTVTTRSTSPMPVALAARNAVFPEGFPAAAGSVHVDRAPQRAVMPVTVRPLPCAKRRVQPAPVPRASATRTFSDVVAPALRLVAGAVTASFPEARPSFTPIVPA